MADSVREQIVQAIITLLETVTVANGYETNLGKNVNRGASAAIEYDLLPAVIVNEGKEVVSSDVSMGLDHCFLSISLAARSPYSDGDDWYKVANKMLADLVKAFGTSTNLGGLAIDIKPESNQTGIDDGEKLIAGTDLDITVQYRTQHLNPY